MKELPIKRRKPHLGPRPNYSKAFYPDPPSHDFLVWLVIAELVRRQKDSLDPLQVRFGLIKDQLGFVDFGAHGILSGSAYQCGVSRAYYETMLANVLRPAIKMIGAVEIQPPLHVNASADLEQVADFAEYDYHIGHLVDAGRAGFEIPKFCPPLWAFEEVEAFLGHDKQPVVITLRETGAQPERNSRLEEWLTFARSIQHDYSVIFLRDTAVAAEQLEGNEFPIWPRASENAYIRAALYQRAYCNLMVSNGPIGWCEFTDAPFLAFKQLVPSLPKWEHGNEKGWRSQAHMKVGDQYPWSTPKQRLTWTDDSFEEIAREFGEFTRRSITTIPVYKETSVGTLSIILATRGRPHLLIPTIEQTVANMRNANTRLVVAVDDDDKATLDAFASRPWSERVILSRHQREDSLGEKYNNRLAVTPADVYLAMVDYAPHVTPGFDNAILEAASVFADGIGVVYNHMANLSFPQINAVTHRLTELMGGIYPAFYPYWFVDQHLDIIAKMIGRIAGVDVAIDTSRRPGTMDRLEPIWWATFFDAMEPARREIATRIMQAPDFQEPEWRKQMLMSRWHLHEQVSKKINNRLRHDVRANGNVESGNRDVRYMRIKARAMQAVAPYVQEAA